MKRILIVCLGALQAMPALASLTNAEALYINDPAGLVAMTDDYGGYPVVDITKPSDTLQAMPVANTEMPGDIHARCMRPRQVAAASLGNWNLETIATSKALPASRDSPS